MGMQKKRGFYKCYTNWLLERNRKTGDADRYVLL